MRTLRAALHRIAGLFGRSRQETGFAAELDAHLALHIDDGIRAGLSPSEARRQALIRLGGIESVKESYRDRAGVPLVQGLFKDVRYALRSLRKSPVIAAVAVLSLGLGIGSNTAIFSVINSLLLRSLPIRDPGQLVSIYTLGPGDADDFGLLSLAMLEEMGKEQRVFSAMFGWRGGELNSFEAEGQNFAGVLTSVTGDYFAALGVKPLLGRLIQPADVALRAGISAQVAMLGYRCWQTRFHGDTAVVGKAIRIDDRPLTIIGVTPPSFSGLIIDSGEDVTVPLGVKAGTEFRERGYLGLGVYGRLKPGISIEQARAQLEALWPAVQRATEPESYSGARRARFYARKLKLVSAAQGHARMRNRLSKPLTVLMALVAIVLLIACVNLANLMLAQAAGRRHEMAVRTALGASAWRLARQLLAESMLLSLAGAALGFLFAFWTSRLLLSTMWTSAVPLALDAAPDLRVLGFTSAISLLTAILFGLAPAWRAGRADPADALRQNTRSVHGGGRHIGRVLVIAQVALSMVVILAAALFVHSLKNLQSANPGFQREGVLVMQLMAQPGRQPTSNRAAYYREIVDQVSRLPGVISASFSVMGPVNRSESKEPVAEAPNGVPEQPAGDIVGPGFFQMIGMRVLAGREFEWSDDEKTQPVTVISQSLAARLFPGRNPIGQHVYLYPGPNQKRLRVVGVVNNASLWRIQHREPMAIYSPLLQVSPTGAYLDIRIARQRSSVAAAAAKIVEGMGHEYPLYIQTLEERMNRMTVDERMVAWLSAFFGGIALLLASIGLYGLMADSVLQRRPEIGIRMALGAGRSNVMRLVLWEVLVLVGTGILVGIPAALAVSKFIAGMLFGLSVGDLGTIALAVAVLLAVAIFAGYLPARHASRIDPITTLRMN